MIGYLITAAAGLFAIVLVIQLVLDGRRKQLATAASGVSSGYSWRILCGATIVLAAGLPRIYPSSANSEWVWMFSAVLYVVGLVVLLGGKRRPNPAPESVG